MARVRIARLNGLAKTSSLELDQESPDPVIHIMDGQEDILGTGGTMRLGNYECVLDPDSKAAKLYGESSVMERHRHRYEVNNAYREFFAKAGVRFAGLSPDHKLVELIELDDHPFFMASQYHPELRSRPNKAHPIFDGYIETLKKAKA